MRRILQALFQSVFACRRQLFFLYKKFTIVAVALQHIMDGFKLTPVAFAQHTAHGMDAYRQPFAKREFSIIRFGYAVCDDVAGWRHLGHQFHNYHAKFFHYQDSISVEPNQFASRHFRNCFRALCNMTHKLDALMFNSLQI